MELDEINYFDIHSHLNFSQFDEDREEIIEEMKKEGVYTITVGTDLETSKQAIDLAGRHKNIYATVGLHPTEIENNFDTDSFKSLAEHDRVVGIGECGLDYYRLDSDDEEKKERQKEIFRRHLHLAKDIDKPLMFHFRPSSDTMDAYEDGLDILEEFNKNEGKVVGNSHFFVGDTEVAKRFLDLDCMLSFDGPITFTREYDEVIRYTPLESIMAETDAPFAAPEPHRGKRNSPLYVSEVVKAISEIKNINEGEVKKVLVENVISFWQIK